MGSGRCVPDPHLKVARAGRQVERVGAAAGCLPHHGIDDPGEHVGVVVGAAAEQVVARAAVDPVGAGTAVDGVAVALAEEEVVVAVAGDRVVAVATVDPVAGRAAAERVAAALAADCRAAGEAGGIDHVGAAAAGEDRSLDARHDVGRCRASQREACAGERDGRVVGVYDKGVGPRAAVVEAPAGRERRLGICPADRHVDDHQHIAAPVATDVVAAAPADERVVAVAAREVVVIGAAEEQVAAAAADERVGSGAAEDHVVARPAGKHDVAAVAPLDPIHLGEAAGDRVGPLVAEEGVAEQAAGDHVVAAAAADPVVSAHAHHVERQVVAVVAVKFVRRVAAAAVDEVVAVRNPFRLGNVAEADRDGLARGDGDREVATAGVGDHAEGGPREAAVGHVRQVRDCLVAEPRCNAADRRLDRVELLAVGERHEAAGRVRLEAHDRLRDRGQARDHGGVDHAPPRVEAEQFLRGNRGADVAGLGGDAHHVHRPGAGHCQISYGPVLVAAGVAKFAEVFPHSAADVVGVGAVEARADQRAAVVGVKRDERGDARRGSEILDEPRRESEPPEPVGAERRLLLRRAHDVERVGVGGRHVADLELRELAKLDRGLRVGVDRVEAARLYRQLRRAGHPGHGVEKLGGRCSARRGLHPGSRGHLLDRVGARFEVCEPEAARLRRIDVAVAVHVKLACGHHLLDRAVRVLQKDQLIGHARLGRGLPRNAVPFVVPPCRALDRGRRRLAGRPERGDRPRQATRRAGGGRAHHELEDEVAARLTVAGRIATPGRPVAVELRAGCCRDRAV